jgi:hypothetical protein
MPAEELVAHLKCHCCKANFAIVTLMFTACERRLMEAEELVRTGDERMDMLWDDIRVHEA